MSKNIFENKNIKIEEKKTTKHFPSAVREWNNSIYVYNKNALNLIPYTTLSAIKLIKSFFNLYNLRIEKKMRTKRLLLRLRRLSLNKIFISDGEFKHTNNKVIITLYVFNRQERSYINRMKSLRFFNYYIELKKNIAKKMIKQTKLKILFFLKEAKKNDSILLDIIRQNKLENINRDSPISLYKHVNNFYKNYARKSFLYIKYFIYYKQLIYINKTKFNYTYLKYLKICLERLYNKNIEFNLVNIKRFYLNSDILSQSITLKLTRNRRKILRYLKNLRKKVKVKNKRILLIEPARQKIFKEEQKDVFFIKNLTKKKFFLSELKYKDVTGFRLETRGRLTKRYTASRSVTKFRYKGNLLNIDSSYRGLSTILLKGNLRSNLQFTKLKSKTRIGSFGIKGWVSGN